MAGLRGATDVIDGQAAETCLLCDPATPIVPPQPLRCLVCRFHPNSAQLFEGPHVCDVTGIACPVTALIHMYGRSSLLVHAAVTPLASQIPY